MSIDDEAARKARADAIRRSRDRYNNGTGPDEKAPAPPDDPPDEKKQGPNYSAWIDKKMRDKKARDDRG